MTDQNRRGGPKTTKGKARSSGNAKIHGLTSKLPADAKEKALVEAYDHELIDHYKPKSPLEILQIERIADVRAKLQYLYDFERVKLVLASKEISNLRPEKILGERKNYWSKRTWLKRKWPTSALLKGELICRADWMLDYSKEICLEIEGFSDAIENKHQFARVLPKLTKYLNNYPVVNLNNTDQWMEKLAEVTKRLESIFRSGVSNIKVNGVSLSKAIYAGQGNTSITSKGKNRSSNKINSIHRSGRQSEGAISDPCARMIQENNQAI
jgi:hypothetical protein